MTPSPSVSSGFAGAAPRPSPASAARPTRDSPLVRPRARRPVAERQRHEPCSPASAASRRSPSPGPRSGSGPRAGGWTSGLRHRGAGRGRGQGDDVQHQPAGGPATAASTWWPSSARTTCASRSPVSIELPFRGTTLEGTRVADGGVVERRLGEHGRHRHGRRPAPAHQHRPFLDVRHDRGAQRRHRYFRGLNRPASFPSCSRSDATVEAAAPAGAQDG